MTLTASSAPADSIFAVMSSPQNDSNIPTKRSTPVIPHLGMMIDRTSFDETDDFGVNQAAMNTSEYIAGPPVIMKDGKVRRRLRWRPKSMAKRRRPPTADNSNVSSAFTAKNKSTSSSSSVVSSSNASQMSRISKKSLHSFASTETASINNTSKKNKKFPISRPSFPVRFDGSDSAATAMSTIGNEGDFVHARINQGNRKDVSMTTAARTSSPLSTTLFAAAYVSVDDQDHATQGHDTKHGVASDSKVEKDATKAGDFKATVRKSEVATISPRRNGLPPLFQRPATSRKVNQSPVSTPSTSAGSTSPSDSIESSLEDYFEASINGSDRESSPVPVPVLSEDDVEIERRLDLCIPSSHSTAIGHSSAHSVRLATTEEMVEPLSVFELRHDEERQERQNSIFPPNEAKSPIPSKDSTTSPSTASNSSSLLLQSVVSDSFLSKIRNSTRNKASTKPVRHALSSTSTMSSRSQDLRFSMSGTSAFASPRFNNKSMSVISELPDMPPSFSFDGIAPIQSANSCQKSYTCPVDVDNGTFLEAEKNLQAIHEMASEHLRQGESAEALEVFEEILRGQLARYGEDHHRVGTALHNIGIVLMRQRDYARALEVYKEAVRVRKSSLDPFHLDVAASLAQLGVAYMERSKYRKAIGAFREALKIRRQCLGNDHPKVGKILNNIGCSLFELDELDVAIVAFEEALDIQRNLLRHPPSASGPVSESSLLSIASTQSNIASIKLYRGQFDEAIVDLEEALLIQQCALGDDHPVARRTQESLAWMERSRKAATPPISIDLLTQLTGTLSSTVSRDYKPSMVDSFYSRIDLACGGWDGVEEAVSDDDSEMSPRE